MSTTSTFPGAGGSSEQAASEFVRGLSGEQKEAVLTVLLREAIRLTGGKSLIPVSGAAGELLGYFVPPAASGQLKIVPPPRTPEQQDATRRALANLDDTFDPEELFDEIIPAAPRD